MATVIEIDGIGKVEVGDDFKTMPPDQQHAFVDSIIAEAGAGKKSSLGGTSVGADIAKGAGVGLAQGAIDTAGSVGDIRDMIPKGIGWLAGKLGASPETAKTVENVTGVAGRLNPITAFAPTSKAIKDSVTPFTGDFYEPETTAGKYAKSAAEFIPSALLAPGGKARAVATGVTAGLGAELGSQATDGNPYARIAGAVAGSLAPSAAAKVITPMAIAPERAALVKTLESEGVPLTAGQRTGNKPLQYMESVLGDVPGAGGKAAAMQLEQQRAFTGAAMKRAGSTEASAGPDAMNEARTRIGQQFDDLSTRTNATIDHALATDIGSAVQNYVHLTPPGTRAPIVDHVVNQIIDLAKNSGGVIAGEQYKSLRSLLGRTAQGTNTPELKDFLGNMTKALDRAMMRSAGPADAEAWRTARGQYRNLLALEKAATGAGEGAAQGMISPSQLRNAVVGQGRGAYAQGRGDLAELARAGEGVMKPLPNSGTGPRNFAQGLLTGGGFMAGGLPGAAMGLLGPALAGRTLLSKPVQAYLSNQVIPNMQAKFGALSAPEQKLLAGLLTARPSFPAIQ